MKAYLAIIFLLCVAGVATAQNNSASTPDFLQKAQTVHIPIQVYTQNTTPATALTAQDFHLTVDGNPTTFQLSRPAQNIPETIAQTGAPGADRPNLLILLPFGAPVFRADAIAEAVRYFDTIKSFDWNVSIMDDTGQQSAYTDKLPQIRRDMHEVAKENPDYTGVDMESWRRKACLAMESMRELPGRRVVISLGDIFHEQIYDDYTLMYDNFEAHDVARAARSAGAFIYASESYQELGRIHGLWPYYYVLGFGPWLLMDEDNHVEGWITNYFSDTIDQIRSEQKAAYVLDMTLTPQQMDGKIHRIFVSATNSKLLLSAPPFYVAPNREELLRLAAAPTYLRDALLHPAESTTLEIAPRLDFFPSAAGIGGTQVMTLGFLWNSTTPPPTSIHLLTQLVQSNYGIAGGTLLGSLPWSGNEPTWQISASVVPGSYLLRVAASDLSGKIVSSAAYPFTVDPTINEPVLLSSLVVGKSCEFLPPMTTQHKPGDVLQPAELLLAGHCWVKPDPTGYFSPQQVLWTLVRMTPTGKFAGKESSSWKGRFTVRDGKGKVQAEAPVKWLPQAQGRYVATAAFPIAGGKLKNGEYSLVLELKGPGLGRNYFQESPFSVYGLPDAEEASDKTH